MSRSPSLVCVALLVTAAPAQVPFDYLVTAENGTSTSPGMRFVDPATAIASDVHGVPGVRVVLARVQTVTTDPSLPTSIPFASGLSTSIAPAFQRATVQGNLLASTSSHQMQTATGVPNRLELSSFGMLATVATGIRPGLWLAPPFGGAATLIAPLANAFDVTVGPGGFAYVNSYVAGRPTQIDAVDLNLGTGQTLGTNYQSLRALLYVVGRGLLAGTDTGELLVIDPTTGVVLSRTNLASTGIKALTSDGSGRIYALTDADEVFDVSAPGTLVYRGTQTVNDIAGGTVDLASFLVFGAGCGQSGLLPMHQEAAGVPSLGNANFAAVVIDGRPFVPAAFVLGSSRTSYNGVPLPLPLDFLRMPGCTLYTDVAVTFPLSLDSMGNASFPLPIPNAPRLRRAHFMAQWFAVDLVANPAGVIASDGGEGIIR